MSLPVDLSLYVHIPFCAYRCRYCNFTFETGWSPALMDRTLDALAAEADRLADQAHRDGLVWNIRTLAFGGGTPGVVPPEKLTRLVSRLESSLNFRAADLPEASLEVNPENVTEEALAAWAAAGLGRLSVGIQTFDSDRLALLGRWCDGPTNRRALDLIARRWKGRWSADLMTGLPGQGALAPQTWTNLRRDVDELLSYDPGHLSLYSLTVEPETDLASLRAGGGLRVFDDPVTDQLWLRARQTLLDRGFDWYEISNFARPGQASVHNGAYWRLDAWAGLGPGAEGTLPARNPAGDLRPLRTRNPRLFPWLTGQTDCEFLPAPDFALEHFIAGWRTSAGLVPDRFTTLFGSGTLPAAERLLEADRLRLNRLLAGLEGFDALKYRSDWAPKALL